jgi:hypothetical protein
MLDAPLQAQHCEKRMQTWWHFTPRPPEYVLCQRDDSCSILIHKYNCRGIYCNFKSNNYLRAKNFPGDTFQCKNLQKTAKFSKIIFKFIIGFKYAKKLNRMTPTKYQKSFIRRAGLKIYHLQSHLHGEYVTNPSLPPNNEANHESYAQTVLFSFCTCIILKYYQTY